MVPGGRKRAREQPHGVDPGSPLPATEETGASRPGNLYKEESGKGPTGDRKEAGDNVTGERHKRRNVIDALVGIETNPGPFWNRRGKRGNNEEAKERRRERRHDTRKERR